MHRVIGLTRLCVVLSLLMLPLISYADEPRYIPLGTSCTATSISMCGVAVSVPAGYAGSLISLAVPSPYVHQHFTVQCIGFASQYQIVDASAVTCALQTCPASTVPLCGRSVPVPEGVTINQSKDIEVPQNLLAISSPYVHPTFTVQCTDNDSGDPIYKITRDSDVSCNIFPCEAGKVSVCNTAIDVPGGTAMGDVLRLKMPSPFPQGSFTVQCLGNSGNAPAYEVTDVSSISCETK